MTFPIEKHLGEVVTIKIGNKNVIARLVDGEDELNQPGISAGFIHFADPNDSKKSLGFGGIDTIYDIVKDQLNEEVK